MFKKPGHLHGLMSPNEISFERKNSHYILLFLEHEDLQKKLAQYGRSIQDDEDLLDIAQGTLYKG